jgi:hypothetical protein
LAFSTSYLLAGSGQQKFASVYPAMPGFWAALGNVQYRIFVAGHTHTYNHTHTQTHTHTHTYIHTHTARQFHKE